MGWVSRANLAVAKSPVGRYFRLQGSGHVRLGSWGAEWPSGRVRARWRC